MCLFVAFVILVKINIRLTLLAYFSEKLKLHSVQNNINKYFCEKYDDNELVTLSTAATCELFLCTLISLSCE